VVVVALMPWLESARDAATAPGVPAHRLVVRILEPLVRLFRLGVEGRVPSRPLLHGNDGRQGGVTVRRPRGEVGGYAGAGAGVGEQHPPPVKPLLGEANLLLGVGDTLLQVLNVELTDH